MKRGRILRSLTLLLTAAFWISAILFGVYIFARYAGAVSDGLLDAWNRDLPRLYEPGQATATASIGMHFVAGAVLLLLGPLQFVAAIRVQAPAVHRWIGRIYATAALLAGIGGVVFIALKGTVGGRPMDIGFGLYGVLVVMAAILTPLYAWRRHFIAHRAWAIRLFALVIGSWLFRMDYGFWRLLAHGAGHTPTFDGPFDVVMAYFFYIPNLLVAELIIRRNPLSRTPWALRALAGVGLLLATAFVALGTYYFTRFHWAADILARLSGAPI